MLTSLEEYAQRTALALVADGTSEDVMSTLDAAEVLAAEIVEDRPAALIEFEALAGKLEAAVS